MRELRGYSLTQRQKLESQDYQFNVTVKDIYLL